MLNIYKHAFTFWHRPGIEPGTFQSQVGHSNHYSTAPIHKLSDKVTHTALIKHIYRANVKLNSLRILVN